MMNKVSTGQSSDTKKLPAQRATWHYEFRSLRMASLSDGLALTRGGSSLAFFCSIVLAELDFTEFLMMPSDFRLSLAALVIRACFKSSLAVLLAAIELADFPLVVTSVYRRCSSAFLLMISSLTAGPSALFGSLSRTLCVSFAAALSRILCSIAWAGG